MPEILEGKKRTIIIEKCPNCQGPLEPNLTEKGFVEDYWCENCALTLNLEHLRTEEVVIQKTMEEFI